MPQPPLLRSAVAALLICAVTQLPAPANAGELRAVSALPEGQRRVLADVTARAFDRIRAARRDLVARESYEARLELAQAIALLEEARGTSSATRVIGEIQTVQARLQDPTASVPAGAFQPVFKAIDAAGDTRAFAATRRYIERAHYYRRDVDAAGRELIAAIARIPFAEIDGPVTITEAQIRMAMIELYVGNLDTAEANLRQAETTARVAVHVAGGVIDETLADVAAPPEAVLVIEETLSGSDEPVLSGSDEPEVTESEIGAPGEFQEPLGDEPASRPNSDVSF